MDGASGSAFGQMSSQYVFFFCVSTVFLCGCYSSNHDSPDAGVDSVDSGHDLFDDSTSCTIPHVEDECNLVTQCGCPDDTICTIGNNGYEEEPCLDYAICKDIGIFPVEIEGECEYANPERECAPGSICLSTEHHMPLYYPAACFQWCTTDSDCRIPGRTCSITYRDYYIEPSECPPPGRYTHYRLCSIH